MLLIESIKVRDCRDDIVEMIKYPPMDFSERINPDSTITNEVVRGKIFINTDGREICIGMSKQVQLAIGLPFECFDNLNNSLMEKNNELRIMRKRNTELIEEISKYKDMNFWQRLKFLLKKNQNNSGEKNDCYVWPERL